MNYFTTPIKLSALALVLALPQISQGQIFGSVEGTYVRSGAADTNLLGEDRALIGFHTTDTLDNMRGVYQFDLSSITETISSISLTLTRQSFTVGDQFAGPDDLVLKDLGAAFVDSTVTWNSLAPDGGDVSGLTLSTVAGYDASTITSATFTSSTNFIAAANGATAGSNILSLIVYSPDAEATGVSATNPVDLSFYRFNDTATLNITVVPEPSSYALIFAAACGVFVVVRRRKVA